MSKAFAAFFAFLRSLAHRDAEGQILVEFVLGAALVALVAIAAIDAWGSLLAAWSHALPSWLAFSLP